MRVVSLVPSWTETLVNSGVNVVGRTRFCVHPSLPEVPVVGGTKDLDWAKLEALKPDLLLLDREENLPWMAEERGWKVHCTHVENVACMSGELSSLGTILGNDKLRALAEEWAEVVARPIQRRGVRELPGLLSWVREPETEPARLLYLIWRKPWMCVARNTFVGSMLEQCGLGELLPAFPVKYPKIDLGDFSREDTLLLFSSEPFPFGKKPEELSALGFPAALVDGEVFSWFGSRSLRFLQILHKDEK